MNCFTTSKLTTNGKLFKFFTRRMSWPSLEENACIKGNFQWTEFKEIRMIFQCGRELPRPILSIENSTLDPLKLKVKLIIYFKNDQGKMQILETIPNSPKLNLNFELDKNAKWAQCTRWNRVRVGQNPVSILIVFEAQKLIKFNQIQRQISTHEDIFWNQKNFQICHQSPKDSTQDQNHEFTKLLEAELKSNELSDVKLKSKIDQVEIPCIKAFLSLKSPFFKTHFQDRWKKDVIDLDLPGQVLSQMVEFIYVGKIKNLVDGENLATLTQAANMFELSTLTDLCIDKLLTELNLTNACQTLIILYLVKKESQEFTSTLEFVDFNLLQVQLDPKWNELKSHKELFEILKIKTFHDPEWFM